MLFTQLLQLHNKAYNKLVFGKKKKKKTVHNANQEMGTNLEPKICHHQEAWMPSLELCLSRKSCKLDFMIFYLRLRLWSRNWWVQKWITRSNPEEQTQKIEEHQSLPPKKQPTLVNFLQISTNKNFEVKLFLLTMG